MGLTVGTFVGLVVGAGLNVGVFVGGVVGAAVLPLLYVALLKRSK